MVHVAVSLFLLGLIVRVTSTPLDASLFLTAHQSQSDNTTSSSQNANSTCALSTPTYKDVSLSSLSPPLYSEPYRPQIHFTPSTGFMNDPNGLIKLGDVYHLYYQYNPNETVAGNQHWGLATSTDLYTWQNHPPAIAPETLGDGIFSGSAVLDSNNTSGLFDDSTPADQRVVAMYTLFNGTSSKQDQRIAYSIDGGFSFIQYEGNPVINVNSTQFRDPKVFWDFISSQWVVATVLSQKFQVVFYGSPDLKTWTQLSTFALYGLLGYQYECPDLTQVPIVGGPRDGEMGWLLMLNINPGAPLGGSAAQYVIGDWNGTHFVSQDSAFRLADAGKDFYASVTVSNTGNKTIGVGWASNWQYTQTVPTTNWRSAQSTFREWTLRYTAYTPEYSDLLLTQTPMDVSPIRGASLANSTDLAQNTTIQLEGNGAFDITAVVNFPTSANTTVWYVPRIAFNIGASNGKDVLRTGLEFGGPAVAYVDRRDAGHAWADSNIYFTDRTSSIVVPEQKNVTINGTEQVVQTLKYRALVDRSMTEIFVDDGVTSNLVTYYFDEDAVPSSLNILLYHPDISIESLTVDVLNSTWPEC